MTGLIEKYGQRFIGVVIIILSLGSLLFLYFKDYLKLSGFAVSIFLIILPSYLQNNLPSFRRNFSPKFILLSQFIIAFACYLNFLGSVDFYRNPQTWWYDTLVHFLNPVLIFILSSSLVIVYENYFFKKSRLWFALLGNVVLIIFFSFYWEFYESLIDSHFSGAMMFGQNGEYFYDTLTDLAGDFIGGLVATLLIYAHFYGYIIDNTLNYKQKN